MARQTRALHRVLICAAVIVSALWFRIPGIQRAMFRDWVDDSFFYVIIADGIVEGRGSTSDGIGATNGYHPLWMWVHVAIRYVLEDPLPGLAVMQFLILAAALLLLYQYASSYVSPTAALALALVAAVETTFLRVLGAGMETGLSFTFLLAILCMARQWPLEDLARTRKVVFQAALLGLFLSRLDGGLFWIAIAFTMLIHGGLSLSSVMQRAWIVTRLFAAPALMAAGYLLFNMWRFGTAMPISGRVKSLDFSRISAMGLSPYLESAWGRLVVLYAPNGWSWPAGLSPYGSLSGMLNSVFWVLYFILVILAVLSMIRGLRRRRQFDRSMGVLLVFCGLHTLYYTFLQIDRYSLSWAHGPELLLLALAVTWLLAGLAEKFDYGGMKAAAGIVLIATLVVSIWFVGRHRALHPGTIRDFRSSVRDFRDAVAYIRTHTDENEIIASQSIGFLGYYSDRRIVSMDGLLNSSSYFRDYLAPGETGRYLRENGVSMIAQSLRRDVDAVPYMAEVLGVDASDIRIEAEFDATPYVPRRYLIFRLSPESGTADVALKNYAGDVRGR